jgi:ABC-type Fe3+/spermidine/putrescine transport system ATPase subunit
VNLDVAKFLGIENLIGGSVVQSKGKEALVDAPSIGCRLRVTRGAETVVDNDQVTLAIRASHTQVGTRKFSENSCAGRVVQVTFLGDGFQYRIQVGTHQVLVRTPLDEGARYATGEEVHVGFPTEHLTVYNQTLRPSTTSDVTTPLHKETAS